MIFQKIKIEQDMMDQMRWYEILKPFRSMLKFRLPYVGEDVDLDHVKTKLEYLDGKLFLQIWEGKTSSETRLVVNGPNAQKKTYDCIQYEDQLYRLLFRLKNGSVVLALNVHPSET